MSIREELRETLPHDKEYRHAYADEILNLLVCTQIKVLREQQGLTQSQLAEVLGTTQTVVSRIENVAYSAWNIRTLKKLAEALDLRLRITFENFGTLWRDVDALNRAALERARRIEDDAEFQVTHGLDISFAEHAFVGHTVIGNLQPSVPTDYWDVKYPSHSDAGSFVTGGIFVNKLSEAKPPVPEGQKSAQIQKPEKSAVAA